MPCNGIFFDNKLNTVMITKTNAHRWMENDGKTKLKIAFRKSISRHEIANVLSKKQNIVKVLSSVRCRRDKRANGCVCVCVNVIHSCQMFHDFRYVTSILFCFVFFSGKFRLPQLKGERNRKLRGIENLILFQQKPFFPDTLKVVNNKHILFDEGVLYLCSFAQKYKRVNMCHINKSTNDKKIGIFLRKKNETKRFRRNHEVSAISN